MSIEELLCNMNQPFDMTERDFPLAVTTASAEETEALGAALGRALEADTSLPRYYSRGFVAEGTKGMISEDVNAVFLDTHDDKHYTWDKYTGNLDEYYARYEHPLWQKENPNDAHGGIDTLVFDDFFRALDAGEDMPIDVYDMATWMVITVLSEESIATGNAVAFPDFTDGKWMIRKNNFAL